MILISQLPKKLQEIAIVNRTKKNEDNLNYAFIWENSPEGHNFWNEIYQGNLPPEYLEPQVINTYEIY